MRLEAHAEPLAEGDGCHIPRVDVGNRAVSADLVEHEPEQRAAGLGGVPLALPVGMEHPADRDLRVLAALEEDAEVADHRPTGAVWPHELRAQDDRVLVVLQAGEARASAGCLLYTS